MKTANLVSVTVAAVFGAGLYAAALLSESARADSRAAAVMPLSHAVVASLPHAVAAPRECRLDAGIDTACSFD